MKRNTKKGTSESKLSMAFITHETFLKKFIKRFFVNKEDVEDVVQEAFLRAYVAEQKAEIFEHKSFLFTTARNVALTKLSNRSQRVTDFLEDYKESGEFQFDSEPSAEQLAEGEQQLIVYCAAVEKLDGKSREVFLLRKVHGMRYKEIAKLMSLSLSSVEKYLRKAMIGVEFNLRESQNKKVYGPTVKQFSKRQKKVTK